MNSDISNEKYKNLNFTSTILNSKLESFENNECGGGMGSVIFKSQQSNDEYV